MGKEKIDRFRSLFSKDDSVMVAFSGGVDSTLLLYLLEKESEASVSAVTIKTPYIPEWELEEAVSFCRSIGVNHKVITLPVPDSIKSNPHDRCYLCKKTLFTQIIEYAKKSGCNIIADGTNFDDMGEHRPGLRALKELEIRSPLLEAGFTKEEIRSQLNEFGLEIWNKPAYACLLTRIPYDTVFDNKMLYIIEESERYIHELGFPGTRVRLHDDLARIEPLPVYMDAMLVKASREAIIRKIKSLGIKYVTIDIEGYRTGSMNE